MVDESHSLEGPEQAAGLLWSTDIRNSLQDIPITVLAYLALNDTIFQFSGLLPFFHKKRRSNRRILDQRLDMASGSGASKENVLEGGYY